MTLETEHPDLAGLAKAARLPGSLTQMMMVANDDDGLSDLANGGLRRDLRRLHGLGEPRCSVWLVPFVCFLSAAAIVAAALIWHFGG